MIHLHVSSINRSGASLMTRLFDGHPDVASYPIEFNFPRKMDIFPFVDKLTGTPTHIPSFDPSRDKDIFKFLGIARNKEKVIHKWGKERADSLGVRKNYLEREVYNSVKTDFDHDQFIARLETYGKSVKSVKDAYDARHKAYFESWENGKYFGTGKYVTTYGSGELFISNIDTFFKEFHPSYLLCPIRNVHGYIASEKTRYARRFYGTKRFSGLKIPNMLVKAFCSYDLEAMVRSWLVAMTRIVLLQEKFGIDGPFIVYRFENLVEQTESVTKVICERVGMKWDPCLLTPTIAKQPWGGSSHQGKQTGVNKKLIGYYPNVLSTSEIDFINKKCGPIMSFLKEQVETPVDMTQLLKSALYDYEFQKKYFDDEEKLALYSALAYRDRRRVLVGPPDALAIPAYLYRYLVRLMSYPRLLKLRLFPGWGKQNYT